VKRLSSPRSIPIFLTVSGLLFLFTLFSFLVIQSVVHIPRLCYYNTTASMPRGFYVPSHDSLTPGHLVIVESANIPANTLKLPRYLLKRVVPYNGELVTINSDGLYLDGRLVAKKLMPHGVVFNSVLDSSEAIILGDSPKSYDSRYFGPVAIADLTPVKALFTWK
jgi:type IV secretory pathway protease TraF